MDIGLRAQPTGNCWRSSNRILFSSRRWRPLAPTLSRIAPVHSIALYEPGTALWQRLREATLTIAALVSKEAEAERQLAALELDLAQMQAAQPTDLPPCWWCNSSMSAMCGCLAVAACSRKAVMQRLGLHQRLAGERPMPGDSRSRAWSSFSGCRRPGWWWWTPCP